MFKKIALIIFFGLYSYTVANAQVGKFTKDTVILVGKLKVKDGADYDYKLKFNINPKTLEIVGLSLTDFGGPNENKSKIVGTYNTKKNEITFRETEVVRSKTKTLAKDFCYINATLRFKKAKILHTLSGKFVGKKFGSETECYSGEIQMLDAARAMELMQKLTQNPNVLAMEKRKAQAAEDKLFKQKLIVVSGEDTPNLNITGSKIKLTVWDKGQIDGDKISVFLNNKEVLKNYTLDSTRKVLEIPLTKNDVDTIKVMAHNEGKVPPNTAIIKIETETEMYPIEVRASLNEVKNVYLRKRKK